MRKLILYSFVLVFILITIGVVCNFLYEDPFYLLKPGIEIEKLTLTSDRDKDGINDTDDVLQGARNEVKNKTRYRSAYYTGGYPPENEGVCTDVVWRALNNAGYNLKEVIDADIKAHTRDYPGVAGYPDPNIDFRRVKNQLVFYKKYARNLPVEVKPFDKENLKQWQGGDFVILNDPEHIAVVSDKRRKDGVPMIIHNASTYPKEEDKLMHWASKGKIIGHFRYPASN